MFNDLGLQLSLLSAEAKRKHPEVREAADHALQILKGPNASEAASELALGGPPPVLLQPALLGCATKNAKVIIIAVACLQRLLAVKNGVAVQHIPAIIAALKSISNQGVVEIQLKILQTVVLLRQNISIHGPILADALLLCFRLQESKIGVVASTGAATLRQLVILIFDAVVEEDASPRKTENVVQIQTGKSDGGLALGPCAADCYHVFNDLCLLVSAGSSKANMPTAYIKLNTLSKTFGLELIESVLSDFHHSVFSDDRHPELVYLLRSLLSPFLIRDLSSSNPQFATTLRLMRVVFLLLKVFDDHLHKECDVFYRLLIKMIGSGDGDSSLGSIGSPQKGVSGSSGATPPWMRVLALEIVRGLCSDFALLQRIWQNYDAVVDQSESSNGHAVLYNLLNALSRLATEKPILLGVHSGITGGVALGGSTSANSAQTTDYTVASVIDSLAPKVAEIAAQAATSVGVTSTQPDFSLASSSVKLQCIDQLDKVDAPNCPDSYIFLLALQCLCAVSNGFFQFTLPLYQEYSDRRCAADLTLSPAAPPPVKFTPDMAKSPLSTNRAMASRIWPSIMSSLSFFLSTNTSGELFEQILAAFQSFTAACGMLDLALPRDAFLSSLAKFAIPPVVVASVRHPASDNSVAPRQTPSGFLTTGADALGLGGSHAHTLSLSPRNVQCLAALLSLADQLAGTLSTYWHSLFEALQNAEYVLKARSGARKRPEDTLTLNNISRLFSQTSIVLDDAAFGQFVRSLARLSSDMVGLPEQLLDQKLAVQEVYKRRASGMSLTSIPRPGETSFGIERLGEVAILNAHRLIHRDAEEAWSAATTHLLNIMHWAPAPASVRVQAAETLDAILDASINTAMQSDKDIQKSTEAKVLACYLSQASDFATDTTISSVTDTEIRKRAYVALFKLLETTGHSLLCGWSTVFDILDSTCKQEPIEASSDALSSRQVLLVTVSFPSMQLICSDFLSALSRRELALCVQTLHSYAKQTDDLNIALTAGNIMWQLSDFIQASRGAASDDIAEEFSQLWLGLLDKLSQLCVDERQQVREGATQILFRCLANNGATLSAATWDEAIWKFVVPPFEFHTRAALADAESRSNTDTVLLFLNSLVEIYETFGSSKIAKTAKGLELPKIILGNARQIFVHCDNTGAATAKAMESVVASSVATLSINGADAEVENLARESLKEAWLAWTGIGESLKSMAASESPPSIDQANLEAFCKSIQPMLKTEVFSLPGNILTCLDVVRTCVNWTNSDNFRPDIDNLTPLQSSALSVVQKMDLSDPRITSAVISELAQYSSRAYRRQPNTTGRKSLTNIALSKSSLALATSIYVAHESTLELYTSNTMLDLLQAYGQPMRLKYSCPPSFKVTQSPPLWHTATIQFLRVGPTCADRLRKFADLPSEYADKIWTALLDCYCGAIVADCTTLEDATLEKIRESEDFDLSLLSSLERQILPLVFASTLAIADLQIIPATLQAASRLYHIDSAPYIDPSQQGLKEMERSKKSHRYSLSFGKQSSDIVSGDVSAVRPLPRERFAYWAFDLLFQCCSADGFPDMPGVQGRKLATLSLPFLVDRIMQVLQACVHDSAVPGQMPLQRVRHDEVVYLLQRLSTLRLADGVFKEAYPENTVESDIHKALRQSPLALIFRAFSHLLALTTQPQTAVLTADRPYRLAPTSQAILGLPEGVPLGIVGTPAPMAFHGDKFWAIPSLAKICLDLVTSSIQL